MLAKVMSFQNILMKELISAASSPALFPKVCLGWSAKLVWGQ